MPAKSEPSRKGVEHVATTPDMGAGQQGQNYHRDKLRRQDEADKTPSTKPAPKPAPRPPTPGPDPISGGQYERGTGGGTRPDKQ
ncbi:MAG: hypothetical protein AB7O88_23440 [Reyranellaceae bacterium]